MGGQPLRIGLVDDEPSRWRDVVDLLGTHLSGLVSAVTTRDARCLVPRMRLDLVLLDVEADDGRDPAGAVTRLVGFGWPVLLYTRETRRHVVATCLRAGASGVVGKDADPRILAEGVESVAAGSTYLGLEWASVLQEAASASVVRHVAATPGPAVGGSLSRLWRRRGAAARLGDPAPGLGAAGGGGTPLPLRSV